MNENFNTCKKSGRGTSKVIALAVCCSIIGGGLGAGGTILGMKHFSASEPVSFSTVSPSASLLAAGKTSGNVMTASEVYEKNVNSTVGITTSVTTNYFGYQTASAASGSGFIISDDGYILTNHHVIEGADEITVTAYDGKKYKAELIGSYSANDIAVLKIEAENLTPVSIGNSDELKVGNSVVAIGNPLGELTFSLTSGVISALDREITTDNGTMNLIQTDCAINSGNSGGALFNMYGEVIGITNAKYSSSSSGEASIDNIGFAIPISQIKNIVSGIIENGYISKPFIGVSVTDVSDEMISYGIPEGAVVKEVSENSPAEKAGLQINDIITTVDDTSISDSSDLVSYVRGLQKGQTISVTIYRSGETKKIRFNVEETQISATENDEKKEQIPEQQNYRSFFGAY